MATAEHNLSAVILAAGMGTRLRPLTNNAPKCLTEVHGRSILMNMLQALEQSGVQEVIIVIGYLGDQIRAQVGECVGDMRVRYVENSKYAETSTSYSLWLGLQAMNAAKQVLVLEGDVFFEPELLTQLLAAPGDNVTVVEPYNPMLDGSFVALTLTGTVEDWIHKSQRSEDFTIEDKFKTVNLYRFSLPCVQSILLPNLQRHIDASSGKDPLEYVMRDMVRETSGVIQGMSTAGLKWVEIDDQNDLAYAEKVFASTTQDNALPDLQTIRSFHGGYWRYPILDFYYLYNHYFPSKELYAVLQQELPRLLDYYPSNQDVLVELLSAWKRVDYFRKEFLVVGNGSSELIRILNEVVGKTVVPIPTFNEFTKISKDRLHVIETEEIYGFKPDVKKLLQQVTESQSTGIILVNPNNPVGYVFTRDEITTLLTAGLQVIVDEAFIDWAGEEYSCESLVPQYPNLVIIKSLTKTAGTAGLRLAYLLTSNTELREEVRRRLPIWNVNSLAERFIELFPQFQTEFRASIHKTIEDRNYLLRCLQDISYLTAFPSYANFVFCRVTCSAQDLAKKLYDEHRILIKDGLNQPLPQSDFYVRFGVRPRPDADRLTAVLRERANS